MTLTITLTRRFARNAASVLFIACAGVELGRIVLGRPWPRFELLGSSLIGATLALLWIVTGFLVAKGTKRALFVVIVGAFTLAAQGLVTRIAGSSLGFVYLGLAPLIVLLERIGIGGEPLVGEVSKPPRPRHTGYSAV